MHDVSGLAWDYYPGRPPGGRRPRATSPPSDWLSSSATTLNGTFARVFSDWNDNDTPDASGGGGVGGNEDTNPTLPWSFNDYTHAAGMCAPAQFSVCSWDSTTNGPFPMPPGWYNNRSQNAVQVFYFVSRFHDHLQSDPSIAWTTRNFEGVDKVVAHAGDGADTGVNGKFLDAHMPDQLHVQQREHVHAARRDVAADADVLCSDQGSTGATSTAATTRRSSTTSTRTGSPTGWSPTGRLRRSRRASPAPWARAGATGTRWTSSSPRASRRTRARPATSSSTATSATTGRRFARRGSTARRAPRPPPARAATHRGRGGYTSGTWASICRRPGGRTPTARSGRRRSGTCARSRRGRATRASSSPRACGSRRGTRRFLDMRNAILQANEVGVLDGRTDRKAAIWQVFANRGMGYFAASEDGNDTSPIESFALPPSPAAGVGSLVGTVTDADTGKPLVGALVEFAGLPLVDTTDSLGQYAIAGVPVGTYPQIVASKAGFDRDVGSNLSVVAATEGTADFQLRRDWAAFDGGGRIDSFTGPNYAPFGCGPTQAIDQSTGTGWSTVRPNVAPAGARSITVKLPVLRRRELVRGRPRRGLRRRGGRVRPGLQARDVEDRRRGARGRRSRRGRSRSGQAHQLNPCRSRSARRCATSASRSRPTTATRFFMDVSELVVYGTASPTCLGMPATKIGTDAANVDQRRLRRGRHPRSTAGTTRSTARAAPTSSAAASATTASPAAAASTVRRRRRQRLLFSRDGVKETAVRGGAGTDRAARTRPTRTASV